MVPLFNFCQQEFELIQDNNVTVGRLEHLADRYGDKPFVFFDADRLEVACIIPAAVKWAVQKFDLSPNEIAAETGIFDVLRRNQAVVHRDQPASRVAQLASLQDAHAIVAVGDGGRPVGVFFPGIVAERLSKTQFVSSVLSTALQTQLQSLSGPDHLAETMIALEKQLVGFHSEQVNIYGGQPYVCSGGGGDGPHLRNSCPCSDHPRAGCSRRTIA